MKTAFATLAQLRLNPEINPRHVEGKGLEGLEGKIAQIRHKGFIDPMSVRPGKGKTFDIIDGGERFRALSAMVKSGAWKKDAKIPVVVFDVPIDEARDIALALNFERKGLSPADEAVGFTRLAKSGMKPADIAAHYALTERLVQQRIAIGSLPKPILEALRDDAIDIRTAQAFTAHSAERALEVFKALQKKKSLRAWDVERALQDGAVAGNDRRCLFVGSQAYEAEGGSITRDLFSDNESWHDEKLLDKLFAAKIETTAQGLKDEGWSFVEILTKNTHVTHSWGRSVAKEKRELTKEETAELKKLKAERNGLVTEEKWLSDKQDGDGELSDSEQDRYDAMDDLLAAVDAKIEALDQPLYTERQKKNAGAVISYDESSNHDRVEIIRGLIKPVKGAEKAAATAKANGHAGEAPVEDARLDYSEALTDVLESVAQKATKLAMVMATQVLAYRMGLAARILAASDQYHDAPFKMAHNPTEAGDAFEKIRDEVLQPFNRKTKKSSDDGLSFAEIVAKLQFMKESEILLIEAALAADLFEVLSLKNVDVQAAIALVDPDMTAEGFHPDAEFFGRLNRVQLTAAIAEIDPVKVVPASLKKAELVEIATTLSELHGWLPPPLRTPSYKGPGSNAWHEVRDAMLADQAVAAQQAAE